MCWIRHVFAFERRIEQARPLLLTATWIGTPFVLVAFGQNTIQTAQSMGCFPQKETLGTQLHLVKLVSATLVLGKVSALSIVGALALSSSHLFKGCRPVPPTPPLGASPGFFCSVSGFWLAGLLACSLACLFACFQRFSRPHSFAHSEREPKECAGSRKEKERNQRSRQQKRRKEEKRPDGRAATELRR